MLRPSSFILLSFVALSFFSACGSKEAANTNTTTENKIEQTAAASTEPFDVFLADFKAAAAAKSPNKMSSLCDFPLASGQRQSDFIDEFDMYFDAATLQKIAGLSAKDWVDADNSKKATLLFVEDEGQPTQTESSITYTATKKGDKYKITAIDVAG